MAGGSGTNILLNEELQRQQLALMKQLLLANDKTGLSAQYANLITAITNDKSTVDSTTNVDTLTQ